jgi:YD repeat-containing protein
MVKRTEGGVVYDQTFDAENRLASVTTGGQTTTFVYDGDGNLVKKVKGTVTTVYIGGLYEVELNNSCGPTVYFGCSVASASWRSI